MTLKELWDAMGAAGCLVAGEAPACPVYHVTADSHRVRPGALFVAVAGEHVDGHDFAQQAVSAGAVAVAGEREGITEIAGVPYLYVASAHRAAAVAAHLLADMPTRAMTVVGITGTNGKSSTVALTCAILAASGARPAEFGTLGYVIGGAVQEARHTTPFGEDLADLFSRARDAGHSHVVMEASSHALEQGRVGGIDFDVAAFTNLTQDHLDYHGDMETYAAAKRLLFEGLDPERGLAVVNADDPAGASFVAAAPCRVLTYGREGEWRAEGMETRIGGTRFRLATPEGATHVAMSLLGLHNVYNALCAATIAGGLGVPLPTIAEGLAGVDSVPGRFESIDAGQDYHVVVDYAHTPDGLENVLRAARAVCDGRIICVFGCGGDRDRGKRPKMGQIAAELSDFPVLTSDNPRTEDPHRILLDAEVGIQRTRRRKGDDYQVIEDRAEAIRHAIGLAKSGDLVLIAGKGHEDYQIIGTERIHFDDREVAREILEGR